MATRKRIIIVSTFSGMDLLMLAFIRAWALPGYGLEKNVWAALMHSANFHYPDGTPVMQFVKITKEEHNALRANKDDQFDSTFINGEYIRGKRIEDANGADVRAEIERRYGKDIFVILLGGPPCQDMCGMNRKKRQGERNRNKLLFEYARFVKELTPDVALMEEAEELCNDKGFKELFDELIGELTTLPFNVAHCIMNSLHYGSNQQRVRTIIMMVNKSLGKMPVFPEPDMVNVKRAKDFLDIQYFHSGNFTDKLKTSAHFMCTVTSGAPAYFIRNGIKVEPTIDELLSCFSVLKGEYIIPTNIPKAQVRKAIANAVCVAMGQKLAETIFEKLLCVKHVGDGWFEPIEGNDNAPLTQPDNAPEGPAPESGEPTSQGSTAEEPVRSETDLTGAGTQQQTDDNTIPAFDDELKDVSGFVLYQGPSAINGANIVAIITVNSVNEKTGPMSQLWILPADTPPLTAITTGEDEAVCGQCKLRHFLRGACYVTVAKGPAIVYKAWKNGIYPYLPVEEYDRFTDKAIRLGAYGDVACIPFNILEKLKKHASTTTCYTHQWGNEQAAPLKALSMASVDNIEEYKRANAEGWRTFRIMEADESLLDGEIICPNTTKGVKCIDCGLCAGNSIKAKNIAIPVHGTHKLKFNANLGYAAWALNNAKSLPAITVDQNKHKGADKSNSTSRADTKQATGNIPTGQKKIINSLELAKMGFAALNFTERWEDFLGQPTPNFNCVLYGMAGEGKSTFAVQFAKYLADNFGRTLYVSGEEGISKTLKDKVVNTHSLSPLLDLVHLANVNDMSWVLSKGQYKYIFIDSLDCMRMGAADMRKLRSIYKSVAFVTISQCTKAGEMRGSNELKHDADVCIDVIRGMAVTTKNRFKEKGRTFDVFEEMRPVEHYYEDNSGETIVAESDDTPPGNFKVRRQHKQIPLSSRTISELHELLKKAVSKEDYEKAAKIRDELERRKKPPKQ